MFTREHESFIYQLLYIGAAIAFLALVSVGVRAANNLWNIFEAQEYAKRTMQEYATYAAYDDTEIRGQELVNLAMSMKGDPFLLVMHKGPSGTLEPALLVCNDLSLNTKIDFSNCFTGTVDSEISVAQTQLRTVLQNNPVSSLICQVFNDSAAQVTSEQMQNWCLNGDASGSYKMYKTCLIYENRHSSTVIGILALEVV